MRSQQALEKLTPDQKAELRAYLSAAALENPDAVMPVDLAGVTIDKPSYAKDDVARISVSWTSEEASSYAATHKDTSSEVPNLTAEVSISASDGPGSACSNPISERIPITETKPVFSVRISSDCPTPVVTVSINDWNGKDLGWWKVAKPEVSVRQEPKPSPPPVASDGMNIGSHPGFPDFRVLLGGAVIILFLVGVFLIARHVRKQY